MKLNRKIISNRYPSDEAELVDNPKEGGEEGREMKREDRGNRVGKVEDQGFPEILPIIFGCFERYI